MRGMVGRIGEQAEVDAALTAARDGRGRLVLIGGPAGIGKTRLADAAVDRAEELGLQVARGYAVDDPGAPPLWPWLRLMRGWTEAPSILATEARESDAQARFRLFVAIADVLHARAETGGLLIVLEDMHWADVMSVRVLRHLVAELGGHRLGLVVTHRDAVPGHLADALPDLLRGEVTRAVTLTGLPVADVAAWLPQLTGTDDRALAAALQERTAGNPLLIRLVAEALAAFGGSIDPDGLDQLMADRPQLRRLVVAKVGALDADARELVDAASVIGERILAAPLALMTDHSPPEVSRLLAKALAVGVLRESSDGLQFEHALVRDAVYRELAAGRRAHLHRRAAEAIAESSGPAGPIATHWQRADGPDAVAQCQVWAEAADEQARSALAHDDAARFAELAVDSARQAGDVDEEVARLLVRLAEALHLAGRIEASLEVCVQAAEIAEVAGRPDLLAQAGLVVHGSGHPSVAQTVPPICWRALDLIAADDHATRARLLAQIAVGIAESDGGPRAGELAAEALTEADRSGDPTAILEALAARHLAISVPQTVGERLELGRRAVDLGGTTRQPIAELWGHLWRADASLQLGNVAVFELELAEIDRVARQRGSALARWHHHRYHAERAAMIGDFATARQANDAARELGLRVGDISLVGLSYAFNMQLTVVRGDPTEMPPDWEQVIALAPNLPLVRITAPIFHAVAGELDLARAEFEPFRHLPRSFPVGVRWHGTMTQIANAAVLLDDGEVAAALYEGFRDLGHYYTGDGSGGIFNFGANARTLGDLVRVAGKPNDALAHYRDAVDMNVRVGARPFTALSRLGWAQALVALDLQADPQTRQSAADLVALANAEFRRLDMPGALATGAALAERVATTSAASPLTGREAEVAELVAQSLSNREIAGRLFLSERTVETHVRSILAKLGFAKRTEVVSWVLRTEPR